MYHPNLSPPPPPVPVHQKRYSNTLSLDFDLTSSSDESDLEYKHPSEEHKFWQVHSSTTIIAPPTSEYDAAAVISMDYMPKKTLPQKLSVPHISLISLVHQSLSNAFEDVDDEIEKEWEISRINLIKSLSKQPTIALNSS